MTDQDQPLTPDEDAVRRALAAARHSDPLPTDVASRLDATLAGLVAERRALEPEAPPASGGSSGGVVVPLRRRRRPGLLLAAAAVVVACATAPTWWPSSQGDMSTNDQKSVTQESADDAAGASSSAPDRSALHAPPALDRGTTEAEARALLDDPTASTDRLSEVAPTEPAPSDAPRASRGSCAAEPTAGDRLVASVSVTWDGQPARLVETSSGAVLVLGCDGEVLTRF